MDTKVLSVRQSITVGVVMALIGLGIISISGFPRASEHSKSTVPRTSAAPPCQDTTSDKVDAIGNSTVIGGSAGASEQKPDTTNGTVASTTLQPLPDVLGSVSERPCAGCDADHASNDAWLRLSRCEDVRFLKDLTEAGRRPEASPNLTRHEERLVGLSECDRAALEDRLRERVLHMFQETLRMITHPGGRTVFLYKDAFECGIPPESLLEPPTETSRKTIEMAANLLKNPEQLLQTPTLAEHAEGRRSDRTVRNDEVPIPSSPSSSLPYGLQALDALPDSDEKAVLLARTYLAYQQKHASIANSCQQMLRRIPSPEAVYVLHRTFQEGDLPEEMSLAIVQLIGESRTEASVPVLLSLARRDGESLTPLSVCACIQLQQWAFRSDVLAVLLDCVMRPDADPLCDLIPSFRGVLGGREALAQIVQEAHSVNARRAALQQLGYNCRDQANQALLWAFAQDGSLSNEVRSIALSSLRGVCFSITPEQEAFLKRMSRAANALGTIAREFDAPLARPDEHEVKTRRLRYFLSIRASDERLCRSLRDKQEDLTPKQKAILSQLDARIAQVTTLIEVMDPKKTLRIQMQPSRDFIAAQERFHRLSTRREEYNNEPAKSSTIHVLHQIDEQLDSLQQQLDRLDPTGRFRKEWYDNANAVSGDPLRSMPPSPISKHSQ